MTYSKAKVLRTVRFLAAGAALVLTMGACGSGKPDLAHGRELFQNGTDGGQACAYCHTLKAALSAGPFAANLDRRTERRRLRGLTESDLRTLVRNRIHSARCFDRNDPSRCMPPDLVTGGDAADVAAFVARCADNASAPDCLPPKPADPLVAKGQLLFGSRFCQGCHSTTGNVVVGLAPTVKDLAGSKVELTDGTTVTADDNYLLTSILDPDAQIVKGYKAGFMTLLVKPHSIPDAQARALVAYIKTFE
jgi:mono/diheme cytochrome c family protein